MKTNVVVNTRLSPKRRPGRDILLRAIGYSTSQIARRDLARYYDLLNIGMIWLRDSFNERELETLARAVENLAEMEIPDSLYQLRAAVEDVVLSENLCTATGIEDCERFLDRLSELDLTAFCALLDVVERYLALPLERRGKEGWMDVGLL